MRRVLQSGTIKAVQGGGIAERRGKAGVRQSGAGEGGVKR